VKGFSYTVQKGSWDQQTERFKMSCYQCGAKDTFPVEDLEQWYKDHRHAGPEVLQLEERIAELEKQLEEK